MEAKTDVSPGPLTRFGRVASTLLSLHVEVAQREAARDRERIVSGAVLVAVGAVFLLAVLLLLQVAGVWAAAYWWSFRHARLAGLYGVLTVAGIDLLLGLLLLRLGARRIGGPVLPATRALLKKTAAAMTDL